MKHSLQLTTSMLLATLVAAFCFAQTTIPASAQEKRMTIQGFGPELPVEIAGNAWFIFLDGVIDPKAATRFEKYIKDNRIPDRSIVYVNSPGGSLIEGIALGRIIRKYGLSTSVGKRLVAATRRFDIEPGGCYSACAYAYMGGQFRYLTKGSRYGVHQFASTAGGSEGVAQIASAIIVEYIRSMDVDTELFSLSASAAPDGMNELDTQTLERLNVINNGKTRPVWSIESGGGQLYLKGERTTEISGINKFMLHCGADRKLGLYAIFDALGRDDELMNMSAPSLQIDKQLYHLDEVSKSIRNGWFNGIYNLSIQEIEALRNAQQVGVTLQFSYDAPVFLGFQGMPIRGGREKLLGFINQCR
jgi:hypothetical protein